MHSADLYQYPENQSHDFGVASDMLHQLKEECTESMHALGSKLSVPCDLNIVA